jgi:hypothetical protein
MESINISSEIMDAVDSYIKVVLSNAPFVQTDIAKITGVGTTSGNKINIKGLANYDNIKSLGDVVYPNDSIVFILYPNGQPSQAFILGQLFESPSNIKGGSIDIGEGNFTVDKNGKFNASSGAIGAWNIKPNYLHADNLFSDGYLRKCYIQKPLTDTDWVFSIQKGVEQGINPSTFSPLFRVEANGNLFSKYINTGTITSDTVIADTMSASDLQMRSSNKYYMQLNSSSGTLDFWANDVYVGHTVV